jgi:hypothetical protein
VQIAAALNRSLGYLAAGYISAAAAHQPWQPPFTLQSVRYWLALLDVPVN